MGSVIWDRRDSAGSCPEQTPAVRCQLLPTNHVLDVLAVHDEKVSVQRVEAEHPTVWAKFNRLRTLKGKIAR